MEKPRAYFITFSTYGSRLHGSEKGSVDKKHNQYSADFMPHKPSLEHYENQKLENVPIELNQQHRQTVLGSIKDVCQYRNWNLYALHIRSNHIHIVVEADSTPEKVLHNLKAYATRSLREVYSGFIDRKIWTRHGSTKYLWNQKSLLSAMAYVIREQGEPMEYWYDDRMAF